MVLGPMKKRMILAGVIGFLAMLLITIVLGIFGYQYYAKVAEERDILKNDFVQVCFVNKEIQAGDVITTDDLDVKNINKAALPQNAYTNKAEISGTNVYSRIAIQPNTILLKTMLYEEEQVTSDMRLQEFNMILLPSLLEEGDYIDIRFLLPTGNDYVVASKKRVEKVTEGTLWLNLKELDMEYISGAIIESYLTNGALLYAIEYSDAPNQNSAEVTYPVLPAVKELLVENKNLQDSLSMSEVSARIGDESTYNKDRMLLDNIIAKYMVPDEDVKETINDKVLEQIEKQQAERIAQASGMSSGTGVGGEVIE